MYSFPRATITKYCKLGGLKQQKCILLLFTRPEVQNKGVNRVASSWRRNYSTPLSCIHAQSCPTLCNPMPHCLFSHLGGEHYGLHFTVGLGSWFLKLLACSRSQANLLKVIPLSTHRSASGTETQRLPSTWGRGMVRAAVITALRVF